MAKTAKQDVGVDVETNAMLDGDVKKGKARKFILIYKGAQIRKLIVFKKGPYNTRIQAAKKEGFRGEVICGVVRGKGVNLEFLLPGNQEVANAMKGASPVDAEPTKIAKLREFLADNGLKRKPNYEIVSDATVIKDPESDSTEDDDDATAETVAGGQSTDDRSASGQGGNGNATAPADKEITSAADDKLKAKVQQVKAAVVPKLKAAVAAKPAAKEQLVGLLEDVSKLEREQIFGEALNKLKQVVEVIKDAITGDDGDGAGEETPEAEDTTAKDQYEADLPGAEAKVKVIEDHPQKDRLGPQITKLKGYLTAAKDHATREEYDEANAELKKIADEYPDMKELADRLASESKWLKDLETKLDDTKASLAKHQGGEGVLPADFDAVAAKLQQLSERLDNQQLGSAYDDLYFDTKAKIEALRKKAHRHGDYLGLSRNAAQMVKALEEHPNAADITAKIDSMKQDIEQAKAKYEAGDYDDAKSLLEDVPDDYEDARNTADGKAATAFQQERDKVQAKLTALDTAENQALISEDLESIKSMLTRLDKVAAAKQYPEATASLQQADEACEAAKTKVTRMLADAAALEAAKGATNGMEEKPTEAVDHVQQLHDQLKQHPQESAIRGDLADIQKEIDRAQELIA